MCGPYDSILGRRKDRVLKHMTTGMPHFFEVATGDPRMCGIVATVDELGGHALGIERVDVKGTEQAGAYDQDDGKGQGGGGRRDAWGLPIFTARPVGVIRPVQI